MTISALPRATTATRKSDPMMAKGRIRPLQNGRPLG
jgi:hypothetical protein